MRKRTALFLYLVALLVVGLVTAKANGSGDCIDCVVECMEGEPRLHICINACTNAGYCEP